ncbi:MAG: hypothetical protein Q9186_000309 [Xanthomendoza sp. 1 TL-2023]
MTTQTTFTYTTITGYFLQDSPATVAENFDFISTNLGLIDRKYKEDDETTTQWQRFEHEVAKLNRDADEGTVFKVLFVGRHGQGVHNVAEKRYGTVEWDRYWAAQEGDSLATWVDPHLTPTGIQQAQTMHECWHHQLTVAKTPAPQAYYSSPLYRCLETANITFAGLDLPVGRPYRPIVKELLRETNGIHTCDRRSRLSFLQTRFPNFTFDPSMTEDDELWSPHTRETNAELDVRMKVLLDDIFTANDGNGFVSLTSHSGAVGALLRVVGHREFRLVTGGMVPVLVRGVRGLG